MIITRGYGDSIVNFIEQGIAHLEEEDNFNGALEEKADFVGILQELPDEYVGCLDGNDVAEGGLGDE